MGSPSKTTSQPLYTGAPSPYKDTMDKILTVKQPYASALVHGVKRKEYRAYRIPKGTKVWIHAGQSAAMYFEEVPAWLESQGDYVTARYLNWMLDPSQGPVRPDISSSSLSQAIYECKMKRKEKTEFPFGYVIGYVIFGDSYKTEGEESTFDKFANVVESFHALRPEEWKIHRGTQGLMPYKGV